MRIDTVLLLYNRPDHSRQVLQSLADNNVKRVVAYLDYSERPDIRSNQEIMEKDIRFYQDAGIDIEFIKRPRSYGLARSVRESLNERFADGADGVILLEDDCVIAPGGYRFFEEGLTELQGNKKIRSLCGFTHPGCRFIFDPEADILLLSRFSTWGWATWRDRWQQYETDLRKLVSFADTIKVDIADFSSDIAKLCSSDKYLNGEVDIWSLNWILLHYLTSTFAAYPIEPVINNIGLDGSGKNCETTDVFNSTVKDFQGKAYNWDRLRYFPENEEIVRSFMEEHGQKMYPEP